MNGRIGTVVAVGTAVASEAKENEVTFLAASVAYYAFVSLIPLLLFTFAVTSIVVGEEFAATVVELTQGFLTPTSQEAITEAITGATGHGTATGIGLVVLLWSALKLFRGLDTAFSMVHGAGTDESFVDQVSTAIIVFLAILVAVVGMLLLGTVVAVLPEIPFVGLMSPLVILLALTVVFLPLYYFLPNIDMTLRRAFPGSAFAAFGWTVLQSFFGIYAANAGQYEVYGAIGAVLVLFTWLYIGGIVIILGAVLNDVLMDRDTDGEPTMDDAEPRERERPGADTDAQRERTESAAPDLVRLRDEVETLSADLDAFRTDIEERTVTRDEVESDLEEYVRKRARRGHASGWGPYLVLLYGTIMTLGAFFFLSGGWAILAMIVLWLSTLGLYVLMVIVGTGLGALGFPGRVRDAIRTWRG